MAFRFPAVSTAIVRSRFWTLTPRYLSQLPTNVSSKLPQTDVHDEFVIDALLPNGKPKKQGRILEDMLELVKDCDLERTLRFVDKFQTTMNVHHVYRCYSNIHRQLPQAKPELLETLKSDLRFQRLCILAGKKAAHFDAKHCLYMIRNLVELGYDSNSIIMQMFLELSKHHVNDLSLTHIALLGQNLIKMTPTSQIDILKKGLALAVDDRLLIELKFLTSNVLIDLFQVFGPYLKPDTLSSFVWNLKIRKDSSQFDRPEVVLDTLRKIDLKDKDLIQVCCVMSCEFFREKLLNLEDVEMILSALSHFKWYSQRTFLESVNLLTWSDITWQFGTRMTHLMMNCGYFPSSLLCKLFEMLLFVDSIDENSEELRTILIEAEQQFPSACANLLTKFDISPPVDCEFEFDTDFLKPWVDRIHPKIVSDMLFLVVDDDNVFRNVAALRSRPRRSLRKLKEKGSKICLFSKRYLLSRPETEIIGILERKIAEVNKEGFSQTL